jgi:hypothetical protein
MKNNISAASMLYDICRFLTRGFEIKLNCEALVPEHVVEHILAEPKEIVRCHVEVLVKVKVSSVSEDGLIHPHNLLRFTHDDVPFNQIEKIDFNRMLSMHVLHEVVRYDIEYMKHRLDDVSDASKRHYTEKRSDNNIYDTYVETVNKWLESNYPFTDSDYRFALDNAICMEFLDRRQAGII